MVGSSIVLFQGRFLSESNLNLGKELEISENTILIKRSIVKFLSKYPRIKKSSLSFHFLKNH